MTTLVKSHCEWVL